MDWGFLPGGVEVILKGFILLKIFGMIGLSFYVCIQDSSSLFLPGKHIRLDFKALVLFNFDLLRMCDYENISYCFLLSLSFSS